MLIVQLLYKGFMLLFDDPHTLLVRSLAACELLYNAGYQNIFWVQGGLESAQEEVIYKCFQLLAFFSFVLELESPLLDN